MQPSRLEAIMQNHTTFHESLMRPLVRALVRPLVTFDETFGETRDKGDKVEESTQPFCECSPCLFYKIQYRKE